MNALLRITDGTEAVDLIQGAYRLNDWTPLVARPKDGGQFTDSPLADGRRLRNFRWGNVEEPLNLQLNAACQDEAIEFTQTLRRLLVKAMEYQTERREADPVYIECRAPYETNTRYALIIHGDLEQDADYFHQPFTPLLGMSQPVMPELPLTLERTHWLANPPGQNADLSVSGLYELDVQTGGPIATWALRSTIAGRYLRDRQDCLYTATNGDIFLVLKNWVGAGAYNGTIRHSTDNGATWNTMATQAAEEFTSIANITNTILIAASHDQAQRYVYIWRSTDSGVTWAKVHSLTADNCFFPSTVLGLATGTAICLVQAAFSAFGYEGLRVYRSTDQGATWAYKTKVYANDVTLPYAPPLIQLDNGRVLSGCRGLWYSDNDGVSWQEGTPHMSWIISLLQTVSGRCLAMQYLGAPQSMLVSDDDAATWRYGYDEWGNSYYKLGLAQQTVVPNTIFLFAEDSSNMWTSRDDGVSWEVESDLSADNYNGGTTIESDGETVLAATCKTETDDLHVYRRTVGGTYDDVDATLGAESSSEGICHVANKHLPYNITHIKQSTAAGFNDVFPMSPLPHDIFFEWGSRCVYFGVAGDLANLHPTFTSLIFDVEEPCRYPYEYTIEWEYSDGVAGWPTLSVADHTDDGGGPFSKSGVECVSWEPPSDWAEEVVDGDTAFWIRACITAFTGVLVHTVPTQQNRQIYTVNLPYFDVDGDDLQSDLPALFELLLTNEADLNGPGTTSTPAAFSNRMVVGTRSLDRGGEFSAFLNASDELVPLSVTCAVGPNTSFGDSLTAPAGRKATYSPTGVEDLAVRLVWSITNIRTTEYYGEFHAFLRCQQDGGDPGDVNLQLRVVSGTGGIEYTTPIKTFQTLNDFYLMDLGQVVVPVTDLIKQDEIGDVLELEVWAGSESSAPDLHIYDLILVPTDEWVCDTYDARGNDKSALAWGKSLQLDSTRHPKVAIRSLLRTGDSRDGAVSAAYATENLRPAQLLPNQDQRVWCLAATRFVAEGIHDGGNGLAYLSDASGDFVNQGVKVGMTIVNEDDGSSGVITQVSATEIHGTLVGGTNNDWDNGDVSHVVTDNWVSYQWPCHSVRLWQNGRYLGARGSS